MERFKERVARVKTLAQGRWDGILSQLLSHRTWINRKNQPCPKCKQGTDRFQYTDRFGHGDAYCRFCGHLSGFDLLVADGMKFIEAVDAVEQWIGTTGQPAVQKLPGPPADRMKAIARRIWEQAAAVVPGDEVDHYLRNRGLLLDRYPRVLRCHPALGYYEKSATGRARKIGEFPAMIACVQGSDGHAVTLHRTYLNAGEKACGRDSKKVLSAGFNGAAIRLFPATDELALAEGIETALAVHLLTGLPVWSAMSAGNLERVWVPDTVKRVRIFADNDAGAGYDGQAAAYALAQRLAKQSKNSRGRTVDVLVPNEAGDDWADVWLQRASVNIQAA